MRKVDSFSTMDVYQAAFIALHGIKPTLKVSNRKVSFNFPSSEKILDLIEEYHRGTTVEALKFATTIKNLKAQIFALKDRV
jgi:Domain of unknown function (DUF5659)